MAGIVEEAEITDDSVRSLRKNEPQLADLQIV